MKNREIASILNEIADIMELQEIEWKPRAYKKAARKIENMSENVEDIYKKKGISGLKNIPTIGQKLAQHIADYLNKGKVSEWEKLKKGSKGIHKLLKIEGLGPSKVKTLHKKLKIKTVQDLKKAIKQKKLQKLKGFGEKTEQNIIQALKFYEKSGKRMLINKAWNIAQDVIDYLKENAEIKKIDIAGSLRRMKETIGDLDILATTKKPKQLMDTFTKMPEVSRVLVKGNTKSSIRLKNGPQVDLRVIDEKSYGAALIYFTGNKDHNIALRKLATKKGYKLSEYNLVNKKTGKVIASKTEKEVYRKLDLEWMPPELRTNRNELEAASKKKIPKLVQQEQIKGDLQMHTKYSDGENTIKEMVNTAKKLRYNYIAITDHSQDERIANGMDKKTIKKQWKEIDRIQKTEKIKILKGSEINILADGSLDYDEEILKKLDIVLVAIHSGFKSSKKKMTERILKGLDNKYVNIFVHPTGRLINKRKGYDADFDKIFKKCKENNIAVEINCSPERLDLNDAKIIEAKKYNIKFSLGTDAHTKGSLENMRFGVGQAKRGWLEKKDIINTMSYKQLKKFIKK
jgi:DNA polymerase (family X)